MRTALTRLLLLASVAVPAAGSDAGRWKLGDGETTVWEVSEDRRLPHRDFLEQGGRRAGQKVGYAIAADGTLILERDLVWPSLRIFPNDTHGSFIRHYGSEAEPRITVGGSPLPPLKVSCVLLDGTLTFLGKAGDLEIRRVTFPSFDQYAALERWVLRNMGAKVADMGVAPLALQSEERGPYGVNLAEVTHDAPVRARLEPGAAMTFAVVFSGRLPTTRPLKLDAEQEEAKRREFIASLSASLRLETPDPVLNRAFAFAKWRVAESINETRGGLLLAPGNLRYYAASWCNDNVEYGGPFFPFLGDAGGVAASLNAYRQYLPFMSPSYRRIPSSVIAEGVNIWEGAGDRGDAAMFAYGAARFALAQGDRGVAEELWTGIVWCLEYCRRQQTPNGVIASDTDELEGRLPTGKANLSTSALVYGGLRSAAHLGRVLGKTAEAAAYDQRADALAEAVEKYFGATVEGYPAYRYYAGNTELRSWICVPLCMGITNRAKGTVDALFSPRMWTPDGLASQAGDKVFWDRSTLYAFRGVFQAGETARALDFLTRYSQRRLLGEHVPYAVEAFPEGGQGQLASESGLYCRIFVEGLFGILPTGLDRFQCTPRLPDGWPRMALRHIRAFGRDFDVAVERDATRLRVTVTQGATATADRFVHAGETVEVVLPSP